MEIIIVSDNHGKTQILKDIATIHPNANAYIHCGDSEMDPRDLLPFVSVSGNNDYYYNLPEYNVFDLGECKILAMHSHTLPFGKTVEALVAKAKKLGCTIACYGHTHRYDSRVIDDVLVINPGSLYYNRDRSMPSYVKLEIKNGEYKVQRLFEEDVLKAL